MSGVMVRKALRDWQGLVVWFTLGVLVYTVMFGSLWRPAKRAASAIEQYTQAFPPAVLSAFGIPQSPTVSFPAFLHAEVYGFIWPVVGATFVLLAGAATVAQELDLGTIDLWLSVPVSRARLLAGKQVALLLDIVAFTVVSVLGVVIAYALGGESPSVAGYSRLAFVLGAYLLASSGIAVLCSVLSATRGRAAGVAGGVLFVMYLARAGAGLSQRLHWLRYFSIFTPVRADAALTGQGIPWLGVLASAALGVAAGLLALLIFQRRDLAR